MRHVALGLTLALAIGRMAEGSTAYGTLNNFDVVNDTGQACHGFEIELEDVHSTDVTYTYDYNHYGTPKITEDNSVAGHPRVSIRYQSGKDANGNFLAFTAVPTRVLQPTDGHQCTNPGVNEGCEHFGVGYMANPTIVRYFWLVDDGSGNLVRGPAVNVATPVWNYVPPNNGGAPQVQAVIQAPEPPEVHVKEFGEAIWVKAIKTTMHNPGKVELKDLVSDDPNDAHDKNWRNGETAEVETEWSLLQEEFANPDGNNNQLGGADDIADPDETVTRRYEFFKYAGPYDAETNEAMCDNYPNADPTKPECDVELLGDYIGAQMAGFNVAAPLGLIDHVENGMIDEPYTARTLPVGGNTPYVVTVSTGALPAGLTLSEAGILEGTPAANGTYHFTVSVSDADNVPVSKAYTVVIGGGAAEEPSNLIVSKLSAASTGAAGGVVKVTLTTANTSAVDARASRTGVWLSSNKTLGDDILIGERAVDPIAPAGTNRGLANATIPAGTVPGLYYLIAEADLADDVMETDEADNTRARAIAVGPDLTAAMTLSTAAPTASAPTTITVTARNGGGDTAGASATRLYRSVNGVLDAGDALVGEIAASALAPRGTSAAAFVATLPAGTYYLIAMVDAAGAVTEARETNNAKKVRVTVAP